MSGNARCDDEGTRPRSRRTRRNAAATLARRPGTMADAPIVVGINRSQDGSLAVARGESTLYSIQKERITRRKHHWGRLGDVPERYLPRMPLLREPVDLVVECYSSDTEIEHIAAYRNELRASLSLDSAAQIVRVSHHLAHIYSAFFPSPF